MGLILDSSVLIATERKARPVGELLAAIRVSTGLTELLLSVVSLIELEHGLWRANTPEIAHAEEYIWTESLLRFQSAVSVLAIVEAGDLDGIAEIAEDHAVVLGAGR